MYTVWHVDKYRVTFKLIINLKIYVFHPEVLVNNIGTKCNILTQQFFICWDFRIHV